MLRITSRNLNSDDAFAPKCFPLTHHEQIDAEHVELHSVEMALMNRLRETGPGAHMGPDTRTFLTLLQKHFEHEESALIVHLPRTQAGAHRDDHADLMASAVRTMDYICDENAASGPLELATLYDRIFRHIIFYDFDVLTLSHVSDGLPGKG